MSQVLFYRDVSDTLDSFDLVLFHGDSIVSKVVSKLSSQKVARMSKADDSNNRLNYVERPDYYTHCGLVIRPNLFPSDNPLSRSRELYIFESTMSGSSSEKTSPFKKLGCTPIGSQLNRSTENSHGPPPVGSSEGFLGVQLRPLRAVLESYLSYPTRDVGIARLCSTARTELYKRFGMATSRSIPRMPPMFANTSDNFFSNLKPKRESTRSVGSFNTIEQLDSIPLIEPSNDLRNQWMVIYERYNRTRYEINIINLLSIGIKCLRCCRCTCNNRIVCSELIAFVLRDLGVIPDTVDPEDTLPTDFLKDPRTTNSTFDLDGEIPCLYERPFILRL